MSQIPLWRNVVVRYCPRCRLTFPLGTVVCTGCRHLLLDKVRREPVVER